MESVTNRVRPNHIITDANENLDQLKLMTRVHQQYFADERNMCEAYMIRAQLPLLLDNWRPTDVFAGRSQTLAIGFLPQVFSAKGGFGYFYNEAAFEKLQKAPQLTAFDKAELEKIKAYWQKIECIPDTRNQFPDWVKKALPEDEWWHSSGIAFPLYRMAGAHMNLDKLLQNGLDGLMSEVSQHLVSQTDKFSQSFYKAAIHVIGTLQLACDLYIHQLEEAPASKENYHLQETLCHIRHAPPANLHEAIQLSLLYLTISGTQNYGRMDEYLGDFLASDLEEGTITENEALSYIKALWHLLSEDKNVYDGRVVIGGKGRRNPDHADKIARLMIKATHQTKDVLPQLSLRFHTDTDPEIYHAALDAIADGCVFPMLYNDDVNIPAVMKAFDVDENTAEQYLPFGCGEYMLYNQGFSSPNAVINLQKALEVTLHNGKDPVTGKLMGTNLPSVDTFINFDDLWQAYSKQVEYHIDAIAVQQKIEYEVAGYTAPFLMFSLMMDDCLEKGKGVFQGGIRYLGATLESYGNTTTADSLTAIKSLVFDTQQMELGQLIDVLDQNYVGHESAHKWMLEAPKYGNDDHEADAMYSRVHNHVCEYTRKSAAKSGLDQHLVVIINNDANTDCGKNTAASANGRKFGESLSNGNAPTVGMDKSGITALLNSITKPSVDIHAGAVQNLKFSRDMFSRFRQQTEALLQTYFTNGAQAMITVVNRQDLERALAEPENYQNLIVRVGGFSARFVDLRPEVQQEILARTLY